ncbi:hypothetical protein [Kitasatospora sp. NPDC058218]|uniref:hypothetical protein n=1 Tax=Kitasatospora sp. NPDC058218 TaxID=3346385 RepID=UPI0036D7D51F
MGNSPAAREIVRDLRRRSVTGESTLEILRWLKDDLAARGLDPGESAFSMINMLTDAFDIGLSPARLVASWNELSERGHLTAEELAQRIGPLIPRTDAVEG